MTEPPPRRSVWESQQAPQRDRRAPPSREPGGRPAQPPPRPPGGRSSPTSSGGHRRGWLIGAVVVLLLVAGIAGPWSRESNPDDRLEELADNIGDVAEGDAPVDGGSNSAETDQDGSAQVARPESDVPVDSVEAFADVAVVARQRFLNELAPQLPTTKVVVRLESGAPDIAARSLDEQVEYVTPYLNRYFDDADELVIVGLMSPSGGEQIVLDEFDDAPLFAESVVDSIYDDGYGQSTDGCTGIGGFALTDFEDSVVVVDVRASCNWTSENYFDNSETIIGHEVMHIAQYELKGMCADVPQWFTEGQAEFVGWNLAVADGRQLYDDARAFAITPESLVGYQTLDGLADLTGYTEDSLEYKIGALAVELLVAEHGWDATTEVMSRLNRKTVGCGSPDPTFNKFSDSFATTFGYTIDDFSDRVWTYAAWASGDSSATFTQTSSSVTSTQTSDDRRPLLNGLIRVAAETDQPYDRDYFGYPADLDANGCDTRDEVLIADSQVPVTKRTAQCDVTAGQWYSPYDGVLTGDPGDIQIDHVVALSEAWDSGANGWDQGAAIEFANAVSDDDNLQVASRPSNLGKSDSDPAEWLPDNSDAVCWYVATWSQIKLGWGLAMDESEYAAVTTILASCATSESTVPANAIENRIVIAVGGGVFVGNGGDDDNSTIAAVYYRNCAAARAAGVAPIYFGEPGYRPALDRDRDGVACE